METEMGNMLQERRVLLVDDEALMRSMLRLGLQRELYYTLAEATNGAEALEMVEVFRPHVVLMDLKMPIMDGIEACTRLHQAKTDYKPLVLMVTAHDDKESVARAYAAGAADFIAKPINWGVLTHRLRWLVKARCDEDALRASEDQFRSVIEQAEDALLLIDGEGIVIVYNQSGGELTGLANDEVVGLPAWDFWLKISPKEIRTPAHQTSCRLQIEAFLKSQCVPIQNRFHEIEIERADGSRRFAQMMIFPVWTQRTFMLGCTMRDITERKQLEEQLMAAQKMASLGTLSAGIAHELNSPLQVITGVSQSLLRRMEQDSLTPDFLKRKLENIHQNGWRCAEIVGSLRNFAHARPAEATSHDLNRLVQETLLLIEHQLSSWSNIVVQTELTPDLPLLTCDRNQISQILINLLTNARDAMNDGGAISLRTSFIPATNELCLQVQDQGTGIPESVKARIFDPFFTTKEMGKGTGLGLSIVAGIMRAYGGEIEIESEINVGTTFTLHFPTNGAAQEKITQWPEDGSGRFDDASVVSIFQTMLPQ
jgi:PAS domain S-box-containing protein